MNLHINLKPSLTKKDTIIENLSYQNDLSQSTVQTQDSHKLLRHIKSEKTVLKRTDTAVSSTERRMIAISSLRKSALHEDDYFENDNYLAFEMRREVKNLEKWQNELKAKKEAGSRMVNKKEKKSIPYDNINKSYLGKKEVSALEPFVDQDLANAIMREKGTVDYEAWKLEKGATKNDKKRVVIDKNLIYTGKGQGSGGPVPEPIRNLETIRSETNKKLLNEVLFDKVAKNMANSNANIKENSKFWSKETGNNFKSLQNTFGSNMSNLIQYETLFQRLFTKKNLPQKHFDFSEFSEKLEKEKNDWETKENNLIAGFEEIKRLVKNKKDQLKKIRSMITQTRTKIKNLKEQLVEIAKRYNDMEERMLIERGLKPSKTKTVIFNFNKNLDHLNRIERMREEKEMHLKQNEEMIVKSKSVFERLKIEHDVIAGQLVDLQLKKETFKLNLKELYINMAKIDPNFQKAMSWVVKHLWKIGEEVSPDVFPNILDEKNILFLLKLAKYEMHIQNINETLMKLKTDTETHIKDKVSVNKHKLLHRDVKAGVEEVKLKISKLKNVTQVKKQFFDEKSSRSRYYLKDLEEEKLRSDTDDEEPEHKYLQTALELPENEKISVLEESLQKARQKLEDLKVQEIKRITEIYSKKPASEKNFLELHNILIILLGENESTKILEESLKDRFNAEKKLQKNQTFSFFQDQKTSDFYKRYLSGKKRGEKETLELSMKFTHLADMLKERIKPPEVPGFDVKSTMATLFNRSYTSGGVVFNKDLRDTTKKGVPYELVSPLAHQKQEEIIGTPAGHSVKKEGSNSNNRILTATTRFLSTESRDSSRKTNNYLLTNSYNKPNFKQADSENIENCTSSDYIETVESEFSSFPSSRTQMRHVNSANRLGWFSEKKMERVQTANPELVSRK